MMTEIKVVSTRLDVWVFTFFVVDAYLFSRIRQQVSVVFALHKCNLGFTNQLFDKVCKLSENHSPSPADITDHLLFEKPLNFSLLHVDNGNATNCKIYGQNKARTCFPVSENPRSVFLTA